MATNNLTQFRTRSYLAKDFDSIRSQLLNYARLYYPNRIQDFSETSLGGVFLDLAAYTGDIMSFYLDHQYNELSSETAVETTNIERLIRTSGVKIVGSSPATAEVTVFIEVPSVVDANSAIVPLKSALPIVKANTTFLSTDGVSFTLLSDVDFCKKRADGKYAAEIKVGKISGNGTPITFLMAATGLCISGKETTESFSLSGFIPFRAITLSETNVTDIINAYDSEGNVYYEVSSLTDDVVYRNVLNLSKDSEEISNALKVIPAPYRFITSTNLSSRNVSLILGGGEDSSIEDDVVPDPSDFAISLPYSKTFSRTSINPLKLLNTRTLGVYSANSTLSVTYRYGGGLSHNAAPNTINSVQTLSIAFPLNPSLDVISSVRSSLGVTNREQATGGEDAPTIDDLRSLIPSARNSQERIVTREDLLARVYSLPSNFGRVFRAAVRSNPNNPIVTQLHVICRDKNSKLIHASDTLKENLRKYLTPYRMITDAIEILDVPIVNLELNFDIVIDPSLNGQIVIQNVLSNLIFQLQTKNFSIDHPIVIADIQNLIYNTIGVISVTNIRFNNLAGNINNLTYSNYSHDIKINTVKNIIYPPPGGMFEFKYPDINIIGRASL